MNELFSIGDEIEKMFQLFSMPQDKLQKLISRRQELIESLEVVSPEEVSKLKEQDFRILERCREAKENLERQLVAVQGKNEKSRKAGASSRYFDGRC